MTNIKMIMNKLIAWVGDSYVTDDDDKNSKSIVIAKVRDNFMRRNTCFVPYCMIILPQVIIILKFYQNHPDLTLKDLPNGAFFFFFFRKKNIQILIFLSFLMN